MNLHRGESCEHQNHVPVSWFCQMLYSIEYWLSVGLRKNRHLLNSFNAPRPASTELSHSTNSIGNKPTAILTTHTEAVSGSSVQVFIVTF